MYVHDVEQRFIFYDEMMTMNRKPSREVLFSARLCNQKVIYRRPLWSSKAEK